MTHGIYSIKPARIEPQFLSAIAADDPQEVGCRRRRRREGNVARQAKPSALADEAAILNQSRASILVAVLQGVR
jgi:hypothetical protein